MRYLTPETDAVLGLFRLAYERRMDGFAAPSWQLVALPGAGSLADQDAWTMAALTWVRDVWNRLEQDLFKVALESAHAASEPEPEMSDG